MLPLEPPPALHSSHRRYPSAGKFFALEEGKFRDVVRPPSSSNNGWSTDQLQYWPGPKRTNGLNYGGSAAHGGAEG